MRITPTCLGVPPFYGRSYNRRIKAETARYTALTTVSRLGSSLFTREIIRRTKQSLRGKNKVPTPRQHHRDNNFTITKNQAEHCSTTLPCSKQYRGKKKKKVHPVCAAQKNTFTYYSRVLLFLFFRCIFFRYCLLYGVLVPFYLRGRKPSAFPRNMLCLCLSSLLGMMDTRTC